jgi:hypothetical protein
MNKYIYIVANNQNMFHEDRIVILYYLWNLYFLNILLAMTLYYGKIQRVYD